MKIESYLETSLIKKILQKSPKIYSKLKSIKKKIIEKKYNSRVLEKVNQLTKDDKLSLFSHVVIETFSKCNGVCNFCPVNRNSDPRESELMTEEIFFKIIYQLKEINYNGLVSFFGNNEPFLDKRLIDFVERSRPLLPNAIFSIYTNGTPLNVEKFEKIYQILDEMIIDNYNNQGNWNKGTKEIVEHITKNKKDYPKLTIRKKFDNIIIDSRGGNAPNTKHLNTKVNATCIYPFHQIYIVPNGNLALCCNDALAEEIVGNINERNLVDIWYSPKYQSVREKILDSRKNINVCSNCDSLHKHWHDYSAYSNMIRE